MRQLFLTAIFLISLSCVTTQKIEDTIQDEPKIQEIVKEEEKIQETIDLTKISSWTPNQYSEFDHEKFFEIEKYEDQIDLNNIDIPFLQASIFYELNRRRVMSGISPFKYSQALEVASMDHSKDMVRLDFYSHRSPVEGKEDPKIRMARYGIKNAFIAEHINIATGVVYQQGRAVFTPDQNESSYFSYELKGSPLPNQTYRTISRSVVDSWMNSIPIRRNILNDKLLYTGVGVVHYKDSKFYGIDKFKITQKMSSEPGVIP